VVISKESYQVTGAAAENVPVQQRATSGTPLNLLDPYLYVSDPHPVYKRLRDEAPVYWDPVNQIWGISRYVDVLSIERDTTRYSSARGSRPLIEMSASMINRDDPRHLRQRKLVSGQFSPVRCAGTSSVCVPSPPG
jgi:cytochrome P450